MATKTTSAQHQFLVVADSGSDADYTTEPRHRVELVLPFSPRGRSSAQELRQVCSRVRWKVADFLPQRPTFDGTTPSEGSDGFYVWLCDEELPFQPGSKSSAAQLRYASAVALAQIHNAVPDNWVVCEEFGDEVWLLDDDNVPVEYITGLLDVRDGRLSQRKLQAATERAKHDLPGASLAARPAA